MINEDKQLLLIYTTGAYLKPIRTFDTVGKEIWVWQVIEFSEPSFENGIEVSSKELCDNFEELVSEIT